MISFHENTHLAVRKTVDELHRAFCISMPNVTAHGYKLPRILLPFTGPTSALQDARVKTHFQDSVYPLSLRILVAVITISH